MNKKIIFVGPCGGGDIPKNGASVKNHYIKEFLMKNFGDIITVDTEYWKKSPWPLLKLLIVVLFNPKGLYIISANNYSAYKLIKILYLLSSKHDIIYWVIGGSIGKWIKEGRVSPEPYKKIRHIIVEGKKMEEELLQLGYKNVQTVPNFKKISYLPKKIIKGDEKVRFVFLSRIIKEKGCSYICDAVEVLNKTVEDKFIIDFYGPLENEYEDIFIKRLKNLNNVSYKGFLDLRDNKNYDTLSQYDCMLFPTFWNGEGFPGVIIDAYVAGLPVIASEWNLNTDLIRDNETGIIVPVHNVDKLAEAMYYLISCKDQIVRMSENCRCLAVKYDIDSVLNKDLLKKLGLEN